MTSGLERAMIYGFNDEMDNLLETSSAGTSEDLDKNFHKAEIADAILSQMKSSDQKKSDS